MSFDMKKMIALSEGILTETTEVKEVVLVEQSQGNSSSPARAIVDVQGVEVSDSYVDSILNFAKSSSLNEQSTEKPRIPVKKSSLLEAQKLEEKMQSLVERLLKLIREAKGVMTEMTATGNVGMSVGKNLMSKCKKSAYPPKPAKSFKVKKNGSTKTHK